ncbi:hypothetical protein LEP1GSC005_2212 [Leptospira santarosai str. ST188]|nr:hypothetical protein LEP1GSC005_2212 [Leptospira santarosai str. ST188]
MCIILIRLKVFEVQFHNTFPFFINTISGQFFFFFFFFFREFSSKF